jgi:tRNA (guanine37-N1)-methyltransferase
MNHPAENTNAHLPPERKKRLTYDRIGTIAIISSLPEGTDEDNAADEILRRHHDLTGILIKEEDISGRYRVARFRVLRGTDTITEHHEFGFRYRVDIRDVFFTPRLGSERMRVAGLVREGEQVLVPFAGAGPFAIPPAARGAEVIAAEMNPAACRWLSENRQLNHADRLSVIRADACSLPLRSHRSFDRIIIPAPYGLHKSAFRFIPICTNDGWIHLYAMTSASGCLALLQKLESKGAIACRCAVCGHVAPSVSRWAIDLRIER